MKLFLHTINFCIVITYNLLNLHMAKEKSKYPYLAVYGVNSSVHEELKNISKNLGIDLSALIKPKLRELRDSYPEALRKFNKD